MAFHCIKTHNNHNEKEWCCFINQKGPVSTLSKQAGCVIY